MAIKAFLEDEKKTAKSRMKQLEEFLAANLGILEDSGVRQGLYKLWKKADTDHNSVGLLLTLIRYEKYHKFKMLF